MPRLADGEKKKLGRESKENCKFDSLELSGYLLFNLNNIKQHSRGLVFHYKYCCIGDVLTPIYFLLPSFIYLIHPLCK